MNSFSGLVCSYLSNYSSFPRAPPMGLLANMLMNTNGGNLSVPGMSLGYREREFQTQLEASEWEWRTRGHFGLFQRLRISGGAMTSLFYSPDADNVVFGIHSGLLGRDGKQRRRTSHEIQLLWQLTGVWPFGSGVLPLDVVPTHTQCCSVFEHYVCVCVCHKVKQHNDTGPITLGI